MQRGATIVVLALTSAPLAKKQFHNMVILAPTKSRVVQGGLPRASLALTSAPLARSSSTTAADPSIAASLQWRAPYLFLALTSAPFARSSATTSSRI